MFFCQKTHSTACSYGSGLARWRHLHYIKWYLNNRKTLDHNDLNQVGVQRF